MTPTIKRRPAELGLYGGPGNRRRGQMEEAITRFKNRLSVARDSYGFFYYTGHGVQSAEGNYLIPVNANIPSKAYLRDRRYPCRHYWAN
ncbi:MAG: hypothetical protein LBJ41_10095 [Treponema sp.]|nr:hypothetical protein [Treponema sp.]